MFLYCLLDIYSTDVFYRHEWFYTLKFRIVTGAVIGHIVSIVIKKAFSKHSQGPHIHNLWLDWIELSLQNSLNKS